MKVWYEIWGKGPMSLKIELLARVKSAGLARLIAHLLKNYYEDLEIR